MKSFMSFELLFCPLIECDTDFNHTLSPER